MKYKTLQQFAKESGYTEAAIYTKIRRKQWPEGVVWVKAPDGRVIINTEGFEQWLLGFVNSKTATKSHSDTKEKGTLNQLPSSPAPLI